MRKAFWILASCGLVGFALTLAVADDGAADGKANATEASNNSRSLDKLFGSAGTSDSAPSQLPGGPPGASLTDPIATNSKETSEDAFRDDSQPGKVIHVDATGTKDSSRLIHAEYRQEDGKAERRHIQQVGGSSASPFDDSAQGDAVDGAITRSPAPAAGLRPHAAAVSALSPLAAGTVSRDVDASQTPVVSLQWIKRSNISVGQECACDLVVKNSGKIAAKEVSIDAYFPTTVRLTHAEPMPADHHDHVTWSFPSLAAGEERAIQVKMIPSKRGELATAASIRFSHSTANVFVVEEPLLSLSLRGPRELMVGDPATQAITVSNPGTGIAHNVVIEAHVTKGLEHPRGERLTIVLGAINPGESRVVRLPLVAVAGGEQTLKIHASAGADLHQDLVSRLNVVAPSVKVALEGPGLRYVGRKAVYATTVTNDGGAPTNNVRVTHAVPEGFRFTRADKGGEYDEASRKISWFIGHLEMKESVQLKCELATTQIGTHVHTAAAISEQGARSEARLETVVDGNAALEVEIIDQNDPVEVGVETAYEVHVRNDGTKAATNVGICCELPAAVELLRAEGPTPGRGEQGLLTFRPLSTLEPGKAAVFRIYVRGKSEGNARFRARLTSDSMKEPLVHEEMTKFYKE